MPAYGSCAGMIMLATEVLDGRPDQRGFGGIDMTVRRNAFGRQVDSFEAAGGRRRRRRAAVARRLHPRAVGGVGRRRASRCWGASAAGPAAGRIVAVRQGSLLATSFHPELTGDLRVHRLFVEMARAGRTDDGGLMSGHSKWATTKHKKAVIDAKRGKLFARLIKNVEVAARTGGGDPAGNPTLFDAIQKAKKNSVPNDNIDRAVKRGSGLEAGGADWQTVMYEGYGPNGVALLIECLTDNRNRAATEVRTALTRNGGTLADAGSVSYMFSRKGVVIVPKAGLTEDDVLLAVLDAGAEEVNDLGEAFEVISRAERPGRGAHGAAGGRHRLRVGRVVVRAQRHGAAGRGRRPQGLQADRRARRLRRRAERLRQLRRHRRRHGAHRRLISAAQLPPRSSQLSRKPLP